MDKVITELLELSFTLKASQKRFDEIIDNLIEGGWTAKDIKDELSKK